MKNRPNAKNKNLAARHGGGADRQGGAQQGTGARGEQYLDGLTRSHTIPRRFFVWDLSNRAPKQINASNQNPLFTDCPFFRSKRKLTRILRARIWAELSAFKSML